MKLTRLFDLVLLLFFVTFMANMFGIVGFRYPLVIENDPLISPVIVKSVSGESVLLADGRVLHVDGFVEEGLSETIQETGSQVEVDVKGDIYVSRRGWICGTPYQSLIRIPIIAVEIQINYRQLIGHDLNARPQRGDGT